MKELEKLKETIEGIKLSYDYEESYSDLYNACIDYENDTQNWIFEDIFENIINYDTAEEIAKNELQNGGLIRLYYFLGDANLNNDMFIIDGYGNLTDFNYDDLERLKDEIIERIEKNL